MDILSRVKSLITRVSNKDPVTYEEFRKMCDETGVKPTEYVNLLMQEAVKKYRGMDKSVLNPEKLAVKEMRHVYNRSREVNRLTEITVTDLDKLLAIADKVNQLLDKRLASALDNKIITILNTAERIQNAMKKREEKPGEGIEKLFFEDVVIPVLRSGTIQQPSNKNNSPKKELKDELKEV